MGMRQFQIRTDEQTEFEIKALAEYLAGQGLPSSKSDVIRFTVRQTINRVRGIDVELPAMPEIMARFDKTGRKPKSPPPKKT